MRLPLMHPLIARFIDAAVAVETLEKADANKPLDALEKAFAASAGKDKKAKAHVLSAKDKPRPSLDAQQSLIMLATDAATDLVLADADLGPKAKRAMDTLIAEGAQKEEARALVATVVLEEAFGYAEEPDSFDTAYVTEGFATLEALARVTEDTVDSWIEAFTKTGSKEDKTLRLAVAEALLEAAFSDGPQPITPEHVDDALDGLAESVASNELEKAASLLVSFVEFLGEKSIVGPERKKRLTQLIKSAAAAGLAGDPDEEDEDEDE